MKQGRRLVQAWNELGPDLEVYVVWRKTPKGDGRVVFFESPEFDFPDCDDMVATAFAELYQERCGERPVPEVIVRLFTSPEEAAVYMETVAAFLGIEPPEIEVVKMKLRDLYEVRDIFTKTVKKDLNSAIRFDLSRAREEVQVPDTIDVIWSSARSLH